MPLQDNCYQLNGVDERQAHEAKIALFFHGRFIA